jgi:hypothetical protein
LSWDWQTNYKHWSSTQVYAIIPSGHIAILEEYQCQTDYDWTNNNIGIIELCYINRHGSNRGWSTKTEHTEYELLKPDEVIRGSC